MTNDKPPVETGGSPEETLQPERAPREYSRRRGLSAAKLRQRQRGLGGTDAGPILGVSRWRTALDVYAEKVGEGEERGEPTIEQTMGLRLEPLLLKMYNEQTGRKVVKPRTTLVHPEREWQLANLDALDDEVVVDFKTDRWGNDFGPGPTDVPADYKAQLWHYMAVTGRRRAHLYVLIGGSEPRLYDGFEWSPLIDELTAEESAFWHDHVLARVPPELDGSPSAERWLRRRYPRSDPGRTLLALPHQYGLLGDFLTAAHKVKLWKDQEARLQQQIMAAMGEAEELNAPGLKITYRNNRDGERVSWKPYAQALRNLVEAIVQHKLPETLDPLEAADALLSLNTRTTAGDRVFRVRADDDSPLIRGTIAGGASTPAGGDD